MTLITTKSPSGSHQQSNGKADEPPVPAHLELVALAELDKKLLVARDRIRQVGRGEATGSTGMVAQARERPRLCGKLLMRWASSTSTTRATSPLRGCSN